MWTLEEKGFSREDIVGHGDKFLIANGRFGYRGTLSSYRRAEHVALNIAGFYDRVDTKWRETVNAPNPFYGVVIHGDDALDPLKRTPLACRTRLDIARAVHTSELRFAVDGTVITMATERFLSMDDRATLAVRFSLTSDKDADVVLETGIDGDVWDLNGPHLATLKETTEEDKWLVLAHTHEQRRPLIVAETVPHVPLPRLHVNGRLYTRRYPLSLKAGKPRTIDKLVHIRLDDDRTAAFKALEALESAGYDTLKARHESVWRSLWKDADVILEGDEAAQFALRYSIYHLLSLRPEPGHSIAARGLSSQVYKGAVFWDTDIFILPFFLNTDPETAKRLVDYRMLTLAGAKEKAASYGKAGAFYAWESQDGGREGCSAFNVVDIFTKKPVRTYFRDKQIHISGDVVHAFWKTWSRTHDVEMLKKGFEMVFQCALFYESWLHWNACLQRYEVLDVVGPDEYHERVDNNAFTNRMVEETFEIFKKTAETLRRIDPGWYEDQLENEEIQRLLEKASHILEKLYVPRPDAQGVIEQFDGYFTLEDASLEAVKRRLRDPREYWGGVDGVATSTQIIKQADVIARLALFDDMPESIIEANADYYAPRTEHGSSLSACMYGLVACKIGRLDDAWQRFIDTATIDLRGGGKSWAGNVYIGGTHPAAQGGAYWLLIHGFAGLAFENEKPTLNPRLPAHIHALAFRFKHLGKTYQARIDQHGSTLEVEGSS